MELPKRVVDKEDLCNLIAKATRLTQREVTVVVDILFDEIISHAIAGDIIHIKNYGKVYLDEEKNKLVHKFSNRVKLALKKDLKDDNEDHLE